MKKIVADDVIVDMKSYFGFHMINLGKVFVDKEGCIHSKLEIYRMYEGQFHTLQLITYGQHKEYTPVDKTGWKDGRILNYAGGAYYKDEYGELKTR